jgi:hypothetical protein
MPRRDIITLDAPVHRIAVDFGNLKMTAAIEDGKSPLVQWAARTYELLLGCRPAP